MVADYGRGNLLKILKFKMSFKGAYLMVISNLPNSESGRLRRDGSKVLSQTTGFRRNLEVNKIIMT